MAHIVHRAGFCFAAFLALLIACRPAERVDRPPHDDPITLAELPPHEFPHDRPAEGAASRLERDVYWLADTDRAGRFPGTVGIRDTERFIRARFEALGLEPPPANDDRYEHRVIIYRHDFEISDTQLFVQLEDAGEKPPLRAQIGRDARVLPFSTGGTVAGPLAFAGYAIEDDDRGWSDMNADDLDGRIALAFRYEPWLEEPVGVHGTLELSRHASFARKARVVRDAGAEALLVVTGPRHLRVPEDIRPFDLFSLDPDSSPFDRIRTVDGVITMQISHELGARIFERAGYDIDAVQNALDPTTDAAADDSRDAAHSIDVDLSSVHVELSVGRANEPEAVAARNMTALVPGVDRERVIVVGAHHDHIGAFGDGAEAVYHGADDNASGTAAVLELAARLSARDEPPPVSVLFVTFTAEEVGLLGSRALVDSEQLAELDPVFMVNLDMIGRNPEEPLRLYSSDDSDAFVELVDELARSMEVDVEHRAGVVRPNSDHFPFHQAGTPFVSLFTGLHEDYHDIGDTADRLDFPRMARIVDLTEALIEAVAEER